MSMTPRERVLAAINHEQPDRVPLVIGVSNATGIRMKPYRGIKRLAGIQAADKYLYDWPELGTAAIDEQTLQRLHGDVRGVLDLEPEHVRRRNAGRSPGDDFVNSWGCAQSEISPGEWFPSLHPLAEAQCSADLDSYTDWPDMDDPSRIAQVRDRASKLAAENRYAIMATPWLLFPFERALAMQGMETFLINMAMRPDFARELLERIAEHCKQLMGHFLEALGENVDIIKIGDDLGTQASLLISPKMYRQILKPVHADYIAFIKERTRAKIFFHSDGDVAPLIDDFIELGVDILNPVQTSAGSMSDLPMLKKRYGRNIAFCGGIDTHRILPRGSTTEIRDEVKRVMQILGEGGGYLAAAVHTVMDDVPPENVLAMADAVREFGRTR
jgi:uroporphyrinogen decarboxylase